MFDNCIRAVLQHYTTNPPPNETYWYGPWNSILASLFPATSNYCITPRRRRAPPDQDNQDFVFQVSKSAVPFHPLQLRTVLVVKFQKGQNWPDGILSLERQIKSQAEAAFRSGEAVLKVYWIGVIGPRWRYGIMEDGDEGQIVRPLIGWHDTTHDQASYNDLEVLATLIDDI